MFIDPQNISENTGTNYPEPFKALVSGRSRKRLGDAAGLKNFGVNLVRLEPGSYSSIRHWHSNQDEFIYILEGEATLISNEGERILKAGEGAGFPAGKDNGHHLVNRSEEMVIYLEIGDRTEGDRVSYPDDDLVARRISGGWQFTRKDGTPY